MSEKKCCSPNHPHKSSSDISEINFLSKQEIKLGEMILMQIYLVDIILR